jgi:hypothetical protein
MLLELIGPFRWDAQVDCYVELSFINPFAGGNSHSAKTRGKECYSLNSPPRSRRAAGAVALISLWELVRPTGCCRFGSFGGVCARTAFPWILPRNGPAAQPPNWHSFAKLSAGAGGSPPTCCLAGVEACPGVALVSASCGGALA